MQFQKIQQNKQNLMLHYAMACKEGGCLFMFNFASQLNMVLYFKVFKQICFHNCVDPKLYIFLFKVRRDYIITADFSAYGKHTRNMALFI